MMFLSAAVMKQLQKTVIFWQIFFAYCHHRVFRCVCLHTFYQFSQKLIVMILAMPVALENGKWKVDGYLGRDLLAGVSRQRVQKDRDEYNSEESEEGQNGNRNYEHAAEEQRLPLYIKYEINIREESIWELLALDEQFHVG